MPAATASPAQDQSIDSQSVRAAETVNRATRGYDAGKKINGRKRHIAVDTLGLLLTVLVSPANLRDQPATRQLLPLLHAAHPRIRHLWADDGYQNTSLLAWAATQLTITIEIVDKLAGQTSFVPLPRRWVVERTLSWITRARRNVRDYERKTEHSEAFIHWSMITKMDPTPGPPENPGQHHLTRIKDRLLQRAGGHHITTRYLTPGQRAANTALARSRALGERGFATLKTWRILTRARCCPQPDHHTRQSHPHPRTQPPTTDVGNGSVRLG